MKFLGESSITHVLLSIVVKGGGVLERPGSGDGSRREVRRGKDGNRRGNAWGKGESGSSGRDGKRRSRREWQVRERRR